jgi:hypothetical protein
MFLAAILAPIGPLMPAGMDVFIAFLAADLPHGVILPILANGPILAMINTYTFQ